MPLTRGALFINYIRSNLESGKAVKIENESIDFDCQFGNLDWWRHAGTKPWKKGKDHPHFIFPDWAAASAIAKEFPDEFIASFASKTSGQDASDDLLELYDTFKKFTLWSFDEKVPKHIRAGEKFWKIPNEAKQYILSRAAE